MKQFRSNAASIFFTIALLINGAFAGPAAMLEDPGANVSRRITLNAVAIESLNYRKMPILTPAQLKEDFSVLELTLREFHPGLNRYSSADDFESRVRLFESKIKKPMRADKFFALIGQFLSELHCYHTYLNPFNQNKKTKKIFFGRSTYFPFYFEIIGGRMIVTQNASSAVVPKGSEVTRINGKSVSEIIRKLLTVTHADGENAQASRTKSLELGTSSGSDFALFDIYLPMFFDVKDKFMIEIVEFPTQKRKRFSVPALTKERRTALMEERYGKAGGYDKGWGFEIREDKTAILRMAHFITWKLGFKYKDFLRKAFVEMKAKDATNLVIDLRGNGGGDSDVANQVFQYLSEEEIPCTKTLKTLIRTAKADPELLAYTTTYEPQIKKLLLNGLPQSLYRKSDREGLLEYLGGGFDCFPVRPAEIRFDGPVYILTGPENSSAAFSFAYRAKDLGLAKLVGQTTGGNKRGFNGGSYLFTSLPNSGFEFDLPLFGYYSINDQEDEGVIPDVLVERNLEDIGNGFDTEMAAVDRLIKAN